MDKLLTWACGALEQADRKLKKHQPKPLSLDPNKETITPFVELGKAHILPGSDPELVRTAITGFCAIVDSQLYHYPENIFWDFDYLFKTIITLKNPEACKNYCQTIVDLQKGYGIHSKIRFQYMHDFTFGFDWARWVAKDPENRKTIKPLDIAFLAYLKQRQTELIELIAHNDEKYPKLDTDAPRNPYKFARTPEAEKKLHMQLATKGLVPLEAWKAEPVAQWDEDYTGIREKLSAKMI
ncbi:MAG: hypothetical protein HRU09_10390 [Oligoflexales bacterium]|nr:hypothetical protein [Oligoflexales bacterium]